MRRVTACVVVGAALAAARAGSSPAPTPTAAPAIQFPKDHGSHPDAAIEWWYWTGHLSDTDGRAYGFQLTFFRVRDLHLAHFAWSDLDARKFSFREKTHLGLPGIASSAEGRLDVSNEDWFARDRDGTQRLHARAPEGELELALSPLKPPVPHGDAGISRKGPGANDYSHYVSITRLAAAGSWTARGRKRELRGTAWFDHEWGPGALPQGAVGWDWFALQLSDGSELMLYRMRLEGGRASPFSAGTYVPAAGSPTPIAWTDVALTPRTTWTSPRTKAVYPAVWSLAVASLGLEATLTPLLPDQELVTEESTGVTYWEGACRVDARRAGRPLTGRAYVEMTGYAGRDVPGFAAK